MSRSGYNSDDAGMDTEPRCNCGTGNCKSLTHSGDVPPRLPTDVAERKSLPIGTAVLGYFPLALAAIARVSLAGQKQHKTSGWDRSKSKDHPDALIRHYLERGSLDTDGEPHSAKMAWRALAILEIEEEAKSSPS